jgi:hypothetical protein
MLKSDSIYKELANLQKITNFIHHQPMNAITFAPNQKIV